MAGDRKRENAGWRPFDPAQLVERLAQAKALLESAAVAAAADDGARLTAMAELQRRLEEERHVDANRRRYR
ncbi:hypothetical protein [Cryptosporangium minutisporangium]|uniref:Uncharacterized protein n=1 Tax=Cryptosporangium minutisporangium TaxID=113569 RepID=A0ABP6SZN7_9ACTN